MSSYAQPLDKQARRKTRFVCISDTHNRVVEPLPKGDVLVHAGDMTNQGTGREMERVVGWLEGLDFETVVVVAGNHDITLDSPFYAEHWPYFHNQKREHGEEVRSLLRNSPSITYLEHQSCRVKLSSPSGPHTAFNVFGSPYSPAHGLWGFGYQDEEATGLWEQIPLDTDVLITHTPPRNHCDVTVTNRPAGCEVLRKRLWSVRPELHVCGHMHEGRGVERVYWDDAGPGLEKTTQFWVDPGQGLGNKKQSLVDLTGRGKSEWIGVRTDVALDPTTTRARSGVKRNGNITFSGTRLDEPTDDAIDKLDTIDSYRKSLAAHTIHHSRKKATIRELAARSAADENLNKDTKKVVVSDFEFPPHGKNSSTCIVNAAIMANSWGGPKRFNKPIVVDIELPVWTE